MNFSLFRSGQSIDGARCKSDALDPRVPITHLLLVRAVELAFALHIKIVRSIISCQSADQILLR